MAEVVRGAGAFPCLDVDREADCVYVHLQQGEVEETIMLSDGIINLDLDSENRILGIEVMNLNPHWHGWEGRPNG
jgi:uncharacterized protein YuzE